MLRPCLVGVCWLVLVRGKIVNPVKHDSVGDPRAAKINPHAQGPGAHEAYKKFRQKMYAEADDEEKSSSLFSFFSSSKKKRKTRGGKNQNQIDHVEAMKKIIYESMEKPGFDPNGELKPGVPYVHFAAMTADPDDVNFPGDDGGFDLLEALLVAGANINTKGSHGSTALHVAAMHGKNDAVLFLLDKGADPHAVNVKEHTPFEAATARSETTKYDFAGVMSALIHFEL